MKVHAGTEEFLHPKSGGSAVAVPKTGFAGNAARTTYGATTALPQAVVAERWRAAERDANLPIKHVRGRILRAAAPLVKDDRIRPIIRPAAAPFRIPTSLQDAVIRNVEAAWRVSAALEQCLMESGQS